jgi:hypothetical protein
MPHTSSADAARYTATDLIHALIHPTPASTFAHIGDAQLDALDQLAAIFQTAAQTNQISMDADTITISEGANELSTSEGAAGIAVHNPSIPLSSNLVYSVINPVTGQLQEYQHLIQGPDAPIWTKSFANELGCLAQEVALACPPELRTFFFISKNQVPAGHQVTYGQIISLIRPQKTETHRICLTIRGDHLEYPGAVSTPTAKLTTTKCLLNSTISTPGARFMGIDMQDFYLNTPMERYEYMRLPITLLSTEIIAQYHLNDLVTPDGWVYIKIHKGMYHLKQAGILANIRLQTHLATYGYYPTAGTPGLWKHHK